MPLNAQPHSALWHREEAQRLLATTQTMATNATPMRTSRADLVDAMTMANAQALVQATLAVSAAITEQTLEAHA